MNSACARDSAPEKKVDIWIVEDNCLLRESMREVINRSARLHCSLDVATGEEALAALERARAPDLVLIDTGLPGMNGIEGTRRIRALAPGTRVVMMSIHEDRKRIFEARRAGATGYLLKPATADQLIEAIEALR